MATTQSIRERIDYELSVLVGQPLWECNRAANMQMFEIGPRHPKVSRKGKTFELGRYALHVQCAWRMVNAEKILFSHVDRYRPADASVNWTTYDPDVDPNGNPSILDVTQRAWFKEQGPLTITAASGDQYGGCRIELAGGFALEVQSFGIDPKSELWRIFDTLVEDSKHFVVYATGISD